MANISWTSTSISNYFNTSLGNPTSSLSGIYNSLNDAALIKSGGYYKLMDSYYKTVKSSDSTSTSTGTEETTTEKTSSRKSTVMDELLSHEEKSSTIKNTVLDKLLSTETKDSAASTYDSSGTKTQTATASTIDESV